MRASQFARIYEKVRSGTVMFLFARRTLQTWAQKWIVRKINKIPNLKGDLAGVELELVRGRVILHRVQLSKFSGGRKLVEARCENVCLHIQWRPLLRRVLVGSVTLRSPHVQIRGTTSKKPANGESKSKVKADAPEALLEFIRETQQITPFRLTLLKALDGRVEYLSQETTPPFELMLDDFSLTASNLTNIPEPNGKGLAHVSLEGRTTGQGQFWLRLALPSPATALTFEFQAGLERVNLVDLNNLLRAFAKFDVKRGVCSVYAEFVVENGHYQGKVEPQFQDLDVFAWQKEHSKSFLQICRQAVIALMASLFKNRSRDELALSIKLHGTFDDTDVDVWAAIGSLLGNAFRRSFLPRSPEIEDEGSVEVVEQARPQAAIRSGNA